MPGPGFWNPNVPTQAQRSALERQIEVLRNAAAIATSRQQPPTTTKERQTWDN